MKKNKILTQGMLDGFCLQYAIMNSFKTLHSPSSSAYTFAKKYKNVWRQIILLSPSLHNFSSYIGSEFCLEHRDGSNGLDSNAGNKVLKNTILNLYEAFNCELEYTYNVENIKSDEISKTNFNDSVLIFPLKEEAETEFYSGLDHWVCAVGLEEDKLLLACSFTLHERESKYKEFPIKNSVRGFHNNSLEMSEIKGKKIYLDQIYRVTQSKK